MTVREFYKLLAIYAGLQLAISGGYVAWAMFR